MGCSPPTGTAASGTMTGPDGSSGDPYEYGRDSSRVRVDDITAAPMSLASPETSNNHAAMSTAAGPVAFQSQGLSQSQSQSPAATAKRRESRESSTSNSSSQRSELAPSNKYSDQSVAQPPVSFSPDRSFLKSSRSAMQQNNAIPVHKFLEPYVVLSSDITVMLQDLKSKIEGVGNRNASELENLIEALMENANSLILYPNHHNPLFIKYKLIGVALLEFLSPLHRESATSVEDQRSTVLAKTRIRLIETIEAMCNLLDQDSLPFEGFSQVILAVSTSMGQLYSKVSSSIELDTFNFKKDVTLYVATLLKKDSRRGGHRYAGAVLLGILARHMPDVVFSERKTVLVEIWDCFQDKNAYIRQAAAESLVLSMQEISTRLEDTSDYVRKAVQAVDKGLNEKDSEKVLGGLLAADVLASGAVIAVDKIEIAWSMRMQTRIEKILVMKDSPIQSIKSKIIELIPKIALMLPDVFLSPLPLTGQQTVVTYCIQHLIDVIYSKKKADPCRSQSFLSLGKLFVALPVLHNDDTFVNYGDIFAAVFTGFDRDSYCKEALDCVSSLVSVCPTIERLIRSEHIDLMIRAAGFTDHLVESLKTIFFFASNFELKSYVQTEMHVQTSSVMRNYSVLIDASQPRSLTRPAIGKVIVRNAILKHFFRKPNPIALSLVVEEQAAQAQLILAFKTLTSLEIAEGESGIRSLLDVISNDCAKFLEDCNPLLRCSAAETCIAVLGKITKAVGTHKNSEIQQRIDIIIGNLLLMGIGDDVDSIRLKVLRSFGPSLDTFLAQSKCVPYLLEALSDESLEIRIASVILFSRCVRNSAQISPRFGTVFCNLITRLQAATSGKSSAFIMDMLYLIQAIIINCFFLLQDFTDRLYEALAALLTDTSPAVLNLAVLVLAELAFISPEIVQPSLNKLCPMLVFALTDDSGSSVIKADVAVAALGKFIPSLSVLSMDDPYLKYPGLLDGLFGMIQSTPDLEVNNNSRLEAIRIAGLLGPIGIETYQARWRQRESRTDEFLTVDELVSTKERMEKFSISVIMRHIVKILRDDSISDIHVTATGVAVKIVSIIGPRSAEHHFFPNFFEALLHRLYAYSSRNHETEKTRKYLLEQISILVDVMQELIERYTDKVLLLVAEFLSEHQRICLNILEKLHCYLSNRQFGATIKNILPSLLQFCKFNEEINVIPGGSPFDIAAENVLRSLSAMAEALSSYRHEILPICLSIVHNATLASAAKCASIVVLVRFSAFGGPEEYSSSVVHSLTRLLGAADDFLVQDHAMSGLSTICLRIGTHFLPYIVTIKRRLSSLSLFYGSRSFHHIELENIINTLVSGGPLGPIRPGFFEGTAKPTAVVAFVDEKLPSRQSLDSVWNINTISDIHAGSDWRKIVVDFIRQSPSPVVRSCITLAKKYRPLADDLFNLAFYFIWTSHDKNSFDDILLQETIIQNIEMLLDHDRLPASIAHSVLNLDEFMEMQNAKIPLSVNLLAKRAQEANMFSKRARYLEELFDSVPPSDLEECINELITVNHELGMNDRALGVLQVVNELYNGVDEIQPEWSEQLNDWDDAYSHYTAKIEAWKFAHPESLAPQIPQWMKCELGYMRCMEALGEHDLLLEKAHVLRDQLLNSVNPTSLDGLPAASWMKEIQTLGGTTAWMLGKWDVVEDFIGVSNDKPVAFSLENFSFYTCQTALLIQTHDFDSATTLINQVRDSLSLQFGTMLSESYSRTYRAMVSMQILSEMEEVIHYKRVETSLMKPTPLRLGNSTTETDLSLMKSSLLNRWRGRLRWAPSNISDFRQILAIRSLVAEPVEDIDTWIDLVNLCSKEGRFTLCNNILHQLGAPLLSSVTLEGSADTQSSGVSLTPDHSLPYYKLCLCTYKYWWDSNLRLRPQALKDLNFMLLHIQLFSGHQNFTDLQVDGLLKVAEWTRSLNDNSENSVDQAKTALMEAQTLAPTFYFIWHAWAVLHYDQLRKAEKDKRHSEISGSTVNPLNNLLRRYLNSKRELKKSSSMEQQPDAQGHIPEDDAFFLFPPKPIGLVRMRSINESSVHGETATSWAISAINGFVKSINLGHQSGGQLSPDLLQDTLRLLTLWFSYGTKDAIFKSLSVELLKVNSRHWLYVLPQLIARLHVKAPGIAELLRCILIKVATEYPQAVVGPISVALNTNNAFQKQAAEEVIQAMRKDNNKLVEDTQLLFRELRHVSSTDYEIWYEGLIEAFSYSKNGNYQQTLTVLKRLHKNLSDCFSDCLSAGNANETESIVSTVSQALIDDDFKSDKGLHLTFYRRYAAKLQEAEALVDSCLSSESPLSSVDNLKNVWDIYIEIHKQLEGVVRNKLGRSISHLSLQQLSSKLSETSHSWDLAIPGFYWHEHGFQIRIAKFSSEITIIPSAKRPRKITMLGSDGKSYSYLLKGNEDLRLDQRVMQLFLLANTCMNRDLTTRSRGLNIIHYAVIPLSNDSGLMRWVDNCDTIYSLISRFRESSGVSEALEIQALLASAYDFLGEVEPRNQDLDFRYKYVHGKLSAATKCEVFRDALRTTPGNDLERMQWIRSRTTDSWMERRENFTKSCAVNCIVGYILGLGDRHLSNIMIERVSGKIVHIDFGECFESTSTRKDFPEIVPFRLTRMLTNCMGTIGLEGTFKQNAERTMNVLKDNKDSLLAMLEAFVYDPLISWKLLAANDNEEGPSDPADPLRQAVETVESANPLNSFDSASKGSTQPMSLVQSLADVSSLLRPPRHRLATEPSTPGVTGDLNTRALEIIQRIQAKLTGKEFFDASTSAQLLQQDGMTTEQQVDRLVTDATSAERLCQLYHGWRPWW